MNTSIYHDVPKMIQPKTGCCWYTSFQMVVKYFRLKAERPYLVDPSENARCRTLYEANNGLGSNSNTEREEVAKELNFNVFFASVTPDGMWDLLNTGPVIYGG